MDDTAQRVLAEEVHLLARPLVVAQFRDLCGLFGADPPIARALEEATGTLQRAQSASRTSSDDTSSALMQVKRAVLGLRILNGCCPGP